MRDKTVGITSEDEIEPEVNIVAIRYEHNEMLNEIKSAEDRLEYLEEGLRLFEKLYGKFLID